MDLRRTDDGPSFVETSLPGARVLFSTRLGGVSEPPYDGLNLGLLTGDDPGRVRENRALLCAAGEIDPARMLFGHQVHGADLERRDRPPQPNPWLDEGPLADRDGQLTATPDLAALVFVADCLPVALSGPGGVAMLHCGWRGLAAGIVAAGVAAVGAEAAAIGPGIGRCCFEVGPEVLDAFSHLGPDIADGRMLDLALVARRELERAGVAEIETSGLCTFCESELFFSHRRDGGVTGRQAGIVVGCRS